MSANYTPNLGEYTELTPFRYWCQKVMPLVYDDSLSYYELLCKVVDYLNKTMEDVETLNSDVTNLHTAFEELQSYVNNYFSTLDVQEEINNKLDEMASDGSLQRIVNSIFFALEKNTTFVNITALSNKRFICIGDSYCGGYTPETGSVLENGWAKQMQATLNLSDNNFYISHNGGTGFANKGSSETWSDTISSIVVDNPDTIDYVIFCGGYNDASKTVEQVNNGIISAVNETKKRFNKAKILIGFVGMSGENYNAFQAIKRTFLAYSRNAISGSYLYMNGVENSLYSLSLLSESDYHHPTKEGNKIIANSIINFLCTGANELNVSGGTNIQPIVTMPNTNAHFQYKNGKCALFVESQTITVNSESVTLNKYGIKLFTTDLTALFNNPPNDNYSVSCVLVVRVGSSTKYINAVAQIYRSDMNTYNLLLTVINDEKNNYLTVDSIKQIQMPSLKLQGELFTTFQ